MTDNGDPTGRTATVELTYEVPVTEFEGDDKTDLVHSAMDIIEESRKDPENAEVSFESDETGRADVLPLDEDDELYGWGIFNVRRRQFVAPLGNGPRGEDSDTFKTEEEALDYFETLAEKQETISHLRIVRVHLDNDADTEALDQLDD